MTSPVLQTVPIDMRWPTIDPFLFCVHHVDDYPEGTLDLGPDASLDGRQLGSDFEGRDGWRMYHGQVVPGFPQHPHRGFETVTYVRRGLIDHSDSLGAAARFGGGDVQWLTAGRGIVHSETFPLVERDRPNPLELFQIWLNLPPDDKLADPYFSMLWDQDVPRVVEVDDQERRAEVTVIAGRLGAAEPVAPPPDSWASRDDTDVAIWHVHLDAGAGVSLPPTRYGDTVRTLYFFEGDDLTVADVELGPSTAAVVQGDERLSLSSTSGAEVLVLQGRPIGAPVAQYGPFVMNTEAEIEQAFADYRNTGFGGWPWPSDEPVSPADQPRFARRPDGSFESPSTSEQADS